jgi:hypothetical protein
MADISAQEVQELFEKLRSGVALTNEELRKLGMGTQTFGEGLEKAGVSVGRSMAGFVSGVTKGETSFKALNPVVDGVVGALAEMAKTVPFAGNAAAGALKLAAEGAKFLLDQLDIATKAFQDVSRVGGLTAKGMTGLQQQFLRSGLTLQGWQKTVTANAETLARFGGTAGQGAERFSEILNQLTLGPLTDDLRSIGFNADDIGEATAGFIQQQTRLGLQQTKTTAQLTQGSKQYAEELDQLARLTGISRSELQKQQDRALSEQRFRGAYEDLISQDKEKQAKELLKFQAAFANAPDIAAGVRDSVENITTKAAIALNAATGGAAKEIIERIKADQMSFEQGVVELQKALRNTKSELGDFAKTTGNTEGAFIDFTQQADVANADLVDGVLRFKKDQKDAQQGIDPLTTAATEAQKELEKMNRQFHAMAITFLPNAATAVAHFTKAVNTAVSEIAKTLGVEIPGVGPGGGAGGSVTADQSGTRDLTNLRKMSAGKAAGSLLARTGEVITSGVGAGAKALGLETIGSGIENFVKRSKTARIERESLETSVRELIDFGGDSGSQENFEKLNENVQLSFLKMANEYRTMNPGKKLKINSAFRDPEKQHELYAAYEKRGFTGIPVAKPGTSLHERGYAIDMDQGLVSELMQSGMLTKYGFQHNPKDPVHIFQRPSFASSNVRDDKEGFRQGGIASGPESGYQALLHGMEAIVPLANNRSIPVSFKDRGGSDLGSTALGQELPMMNEAINRQSEMLQKQLEKSEAMIQALNRFASGEQMQTMISKLDTLGDKMSTSNDINTKLLQVSM